MMNRKSWKSVLAAALCLGLLSGCSVPAPDVSASGSSADSSSAVQESILLSEAEVLAHVSDPAVLPLPGGFTVETCRILEHIPSSDGQKDVIRCLLLGSSEVAQFEHEYNLFYHRTEDGWDLDNIRPAGQDSWTESFVDAQGGDILESIVWLDNFDPDLLKGLRYAGEAGGEHYFQRKDGQHVSLYNHGGSCLHTFVVEEDSGFVPVQAFSSKSGELFMACDYLYNSNFEPISQRYDMVLYDELRDVCIVADVGEHRTLYGAINLQGEVIKPVAFNSICEMYEDSPLCQEAAQSQFPDSIDFQEQYCPELLRVDGVYCYDGQEDLDHLHTDVITAQGRRVLDFDYAVARPYVNEPLIAVYPDASKPYFRFYDYNGLCRSPEFVRVQDSLVVDTGIVIYQGRAGMLPQILTDEEQTFFRTQWAAQQG